MSRTEPAETPLGDAFHVYDTTLRDGAQREGLSLSVLDKLLIARQLDELGVGFIEGGWPGANPKDTEFFRRAQTELDLRHATLAAFGSLKVAQCLTRSPSRRTVTAAYSANQEATSRFCQPPRSSSACGKSQW